jgi:hypothetical protein
MSFPQNFFPYPPPGGLTGTDTFIGVGNFFKSHLPQIYGIVQNSFIVHPKELIIASLRDFFSHDFYYHFDYDAWGFANTTDHTDLPLDAGFHNNITTRLFIGENYRYDGIFYPAILVKHGGARYVPISINRDSTKVQWQYRTFEDGYGNVSSFRYPEAFVFSGAWEGSLIIDVMTRSLRARDDLVELISIYFTQIGFESLRKAGIVVKPLSVSAPTETDDRNDKLFRQSVTLDIRNEWQVRKPVSNIVEIINFSIEFGNLAVSPPVIDPNLTINTNLSLIDIMVGV